MTSVHYSHFHVCQVWIGIVHLVRVELHLTTSHLAMASRWRMTRIVTLDFLLEFLSDEILVTRRVIIIWEELS